MRVKGNHPLAELLAKQLFGIENAPQSVIKEMVRRAIKEAVSWHEDNKIKDSSHQPE